MIKLRLLFVLILCSFSAIAQQEKVDSIYTVLKKNMKDTARVNNYNSLAEFYLAVNTDSTLHYAKVAIKKSEKINYKKGIGVGYMNLGMALADLNEYDSALAKLATSEKYFDKDQYFHLGNLYNERGRIYFSLGKMAECKKVFERTLEFKKLTKDSLGLAVAYNNLGVVCRNMADYQCALENYFNSLNIRERKKDIKGIAASYTNIAIVYGNLGQHEKSLEYDFKALKIKQQVGDKFAIAKSYNNIGSTYSTIKKYPEAIEYNQKAVEIRKQINDQTGLASSYYNLGGIYTELGDYEKARTYLLDAQKIYLDLKELSGQSLCLMALGANERHAGNYLKAIEYLKQALALVEETETKDQLKDIYSELAIATAKAGDHRSAYEWTQKLMNYKDSTLNAENTSRLAELEKIYQTEKKELQIKNLEQENDLKQTEIKSNRQRMILLGALLVLALALGIFAFVSLRNKHRANKIITLQKQEVEAQKHIIEEKNKDITDSINYARQIQQAILPFEERIREVLPQFSVLFKPKDIVSGDFYWFTQKQDVAFIAVVDCTGHGVPGAFMSMVGSAALNHIVIERGLNDPGEILAELNKEIRQSLNQGQGSNRDGMDLALCSINTTILELKFAGAMNEAFIIQDSELIILKGNKFAIGGLQDETNRAFNTQTLQLKPGSKIYLSSDGYSDQFGGKDGKKFKASRFKEFIQKISSEPVVKQKSLLEQNIEEWRGSLEQVDDICVVVIGV